jgi:hypothetical protein
MPARRRVAGEGQAEAGELGGWVESTEGQAGEGGAGRQSSGGNCSRRRQPVAAARGHGGEGGGGGGS